MNIYFLAPLLDFLSLLSTVSSSSAQNMKKDTIRFRFEFHPPCTETVSLKDFKDGIISSKNDQETALTRLNDILHCPNANSLLEKLNRTSFEEIAEKAKVDGTVPQAFREAFGNKLKEFSRGAGNEGRLEIFFGCRNLINKLANGLEKKNYKNTTICQSGQCSKDDINRLLNTLMVVSDGNKQMPSDCAHYTMKDQVSNMMKFIKENKMGPNYLISGEELAENLHKTYTQSSPFGVDYIGDDVKSRKIRERIEYLLKLWEQQETQSVNVQEQEQEQDL